MIDKTDSLHAQLKCHKVAIEKARRIIAAALAAHSPWAISFSGGKDSTVLLHLVREQVPGTMAVFVDSGAEYPETLEFVALIPNIITIHPAMGILDMYRETGMFGAKAKTPGTHWKSGTITETMIRAPLEWGAEMYGYIGNFTGLRAEESAGRAALSGAKRRVWRQASGLWRCEPLMHFAVADVWAYIATHGLIYNAIYDRLQELGVPRERQRVASYAGGSVIGRGRWAVLKRGWPDLFNRFAAEFPEARCYT